MNKRELSKVVYTKEAQQRILNNSCASCGLPKTEWKRRRDWKCCSASCTKTFYESMLVATSWADLRAKVIHRDNYTCTSCGTRPTTEDVVFTQDNNTRRITVGDDSQLVADHIVPISLGGAQWDANNIQTLCKPCNKAKTRKDVELITKERRMEATPQQLNKMLQEALARGEMNGT